MNGLDLERPANVRRVYDAISSQYVLGAVLDLYGKEEAPAVLDALTGLLNGPKLTLWEKAGILYDRFGAGQ